MFERHKYKILCNNDFSNINYFQQHYNLDIFSYVTDRRRLQLCRCSSCIGKSKLYSFRGNYIFVLR